MHLTSQHCHVFISGNLCTVPSKKRATLSNPTKHLVASWESLIFVGASVTFKTLTEEMKITIRSTVRTATKEGAHKNRRAESQAPTLSPKPIAANLQIGEQVKGIPNSCTTDDIDHGTKRKMKS